MNFRKTLPPCSAPPRAFTNDWTIFGRLLADDAPMNDRAVSDDVFVLRLRRAGSSDGRLCGYVEHVETKERTYFRRFEQLCSFLLTRNATIEAELDQ